MAYVVPNTNIRLLRGVPLSKDHDNSILFDSLTAQTNYFISKTAYSFSACSYQRERPAVSINGLSAEAAITCNYMMYQNAAYSNKWFYAFIDRVDYVNDGACRVTFTLDPIQTWAFDYQLTDCFIERNHTAEDYLGLSLTPEPVGSKDYVANEVWQRIAGVDSISHELLTGEYAIVLVWHYDDTDSDGSYAVGGLVQNVYSALNYRVFPADDTKSTGSFTFKGQTYNYTNKSPIDIIGIWIAAIEATTSMGAQAIQAIYMIPADIFGGIANIPAGGVDFPAEAPIFQNNIYNLRGISLQGTTDASGTVQPVDLNGYVPRNKKLYTYPFNYLELNNGSGDKLQLRYERFLDPDYLAISVKEAVIQPASIVVEPCYYDYDLEAGGGARANHDYQLSLSNFPQCSWISDTYAAWAAQNSINMPSQITSGVGMSALSALVTGSVMPVIGAGLGTIVGNLLGAQAAKASPDTVKGSQTSGNGSIPQDRCNIYVNRKSIDAESARIADDYFTMYGYSINHLEHITAANDPRRRRPHYTYLKTIGCDIQGDLPADDAADINAIYDKGIRFWLNPAEIGDYSVDNSPTT